MIPFTYDEFITRNIGFVSEQQQQQLQKAKVFIAGVGGMGGAAVACLARSGISHFVIADIDTFEVSNLNRQIFANLDTIDQDKAQSTAEAIQKINPTCKVTVLGSEWVEQIPEILASVDVAINGCDDAKATIKLMREAQKSNKTVIDAFASPLPNVYVVKPTDPRPEQTFGYPTFGKSIESIDEESAALCLQKEIEWVLVHSSSAEHIELDIAAEMIAGTRKRISFAPMVWSTGCLMAYEAIRIILKKPGGAGHKGIFFNPWTWKIEHPKNPLSAAFRKFFVKRFLKKLLSS